MISGEIESRRVQMARSAYIRPQIVATFRRYHTHSSISILLRMNGRSLMSSEDKQEVAACPWDCPPHAVLLLQRFEKRCGKCARAVQ